MREGSKVYFKATKDNIFVILDPIADFDEIKDSLNIKAAKAKRFFGEGDAFVIFKGRRLTDNDESQLVKIIEEQTDLRIYVMQEKDKNPEYEIDDDTSEFTSYSNLIKPMNMIMAAFPSESSAISERLGGAVFHKGSLRSGMRVESEGSVIVIGDVNPGGEIIAGGNIVVLGTLKGLAHAGAFGNKDTFIAALSLQPVQLRIANMITSFAEEFGKQDADISNTPSYVYVLDERIYIEPLM